MFHRHRTLETISAQHRADGESQRIDTISRRHQQEQQEQLCQSGALLRCLHII